MGHSNLLRNHLGGIAILSEKSEMRVVIACEAPLLGALLRLSIEDAGFEVIREVSQSTELLIAVGQYVPDIVILDLELPEVENIKLIESILDLDSTLAIVTVSNSEDDLGEMKPFSMYDLIDIVRKVAPVYRSHS